MLPHPLSQCLARRERPLPPPCRGGPARQRLVRGPSDGPAPGPPVQSEGPVLLLRQAPAILTLGRGEGVLWTGWWGCGGALGGHASPSGEIGRKRKWVSSVFFQPAGLTNHRPMVCVPGTLARFRQVPRHWLAQAQVIAWVAGAVSYVFLTINACVLHSWSSGSDLDRPTFAPPDKCQRSIFPKSSQNPRTNLGDPGDACTRCPCRG